MTLVKDYLGPADGGAWFSDAQWLQALLRFESGLARAQADCGLIPEPAAQAIASACAQAPLDRDRIAEQARASGALGLALVKPLQQCLQPLRIGQPGAAAGRAQIVVHQRHVARSGLRPWLPMP